MVPEGYIEYKRREFCKDVKCPVQIELNQQTEGSPAYEQARHKCEHRMSIHNMAVSSLAHRKRIFDSSTVKGKDLIHLVVYLKHTLISGNVRTNKSCFLNFDYGLVF